MAPAPSNQLSQTERRLCLFVSLLDEDVAEQVVATFPEARIKDFRECVKEFSISPPPADEVESVIDEFDRMFRLLRSVKGGVEKTEEEGQANPSSATGTPRPSSATDNGLDLTTAAAATAEPVGGAALEQLQLLAPQRIAAALRDEQPQIVAIVTKQMPDDRAGEMLACLSGELRSAVMLKLKSPLSPAPRLVEQLLDATVRRAISIDPRELAAAGPTEERMARLLRSMNRKQRMETLTKLTEEDSDLAESVQRNMFRFEDLLRMDDRSIKSLLAEVESESLSMALKGASAEYLDRVIANLSRRAGESLTEEIEFMAPVAEETQENARMRIVQVITKLDQEGALTIVENQEAS